MEQLSPELQSLPFVITFLDTYVPAGPSHQVLMILCDNAIKFSRDDVSPPCVACRPLGKLESLIFQSLHPVWCVHVVPDSRGRL
jgi:hypothetical protein